ncbi:hypothetical protein EJB05_25813, partial [Eragrostis curvula]
MKDETAPGNFPHPRSDSKRNETGLFIDNSSPRLPRTSGDGVPPLPSPAMAPAGDEENGRRASSSPPSIPLPVALCPAGPALTAPDCQTLAAANPSSPRVEPRVAAPAEDEENGRRASSSPPTVPLPVALCPAGPAVASPDCQTLAAANPSSPRVEPRVAAPEVAPDIGIVAQDYSLFRLCENYAIVS